MRLSQLTDSYSITSKACALIYCIYLNQSQATQLAIDNNKLNIIHRLAILLFQNRSHSVELIAIWRTIYVCIIDVINLL